MLMFMWLHAFSFCLELKISRPSGVTMAAACKALANSGGYFDINLILTFVSLTQLTRRGHMLSGTCF